MIRLIDSPCGRLAETAEIAGILARLVAKMRVPVTNDAGPVRAHRVAVA